LALGGAVLDSAKLAWVFYEHPDADLDRIARPFGLGPMRGKARLAAVPTTAGTGSEVSSAAVFLDPDHGGKRYIVSHDLLPDLALLDSRFLASCPAPVVAASGLDALAHCLESYVSRFDNPLLDLQAEAAARVIFATLPSLVENPANPAAAMDMANAALMAGWVQNLKLPGIGHAVAHQMGHLGLGHGVSCAAFLVPAMRLNLQDESARGKYDQLGSRLGFGDAQGLLAAVESLLSTVGMAVPLGSRLDGGKEQILRGKQEIIEGAMADICARANPVTVDEGAVEQVLEAAV
jgi:alcohol dehydrogenase class IV